MGGAGNHISFTDKAGAVVEPPPTIVFKVTNALDSEYEYRVELGEEVTHLPERLSIEVVEVIRKKIRPSNKPPYKFLITDKHGVIRVIRSMDEENAIRIYHASNEKPLEIESVEIVIPGV